ncbi:hypothetical protein Sgly_1076 [Syntrophobotulus glycolicus DSM 8271]|uniref:HicB-like antitoxin of toxin-antitoxin system domain-containing protein n=1 Tax=Syntrophobotulus glycolicus (strain DSM 8271 / FlGlyR) TaxID=645991 RepID=F0SU19_SYNGF|nr:hypothetical protein [Syntrophobotulus glycolicus]ADY55402.1 hypothetical protein Sgly_1076 [Syntrophobotulus glycolicus DSM 8271]
MKKYVFTANIGKDEVTGKYKASFPYFPDCSVGGDTFLDTYFMAWTMLERYLYDLVKADMPIPEESYISDSPRQAAVPMEVDMLEIRRKYDKDLINKSIRIPRRLDDMAKAEKINFSQTLREALEEKLEIND